MKRKVTRRHRARNDNGILPLFAWADAFRQRPWARSLAAREIQRRGAYPPSTATLYARLAGLCVEED
jgi:hypothetical protein